eukprot:1248397-Prymnesium_polylepis.1
MRRQAEGAGGSLNVVDVDLRVWQGAEPGSGAAASYRRGGERREGGQHDPGKHAFKTQALSAGGPRRRYFLFLGLISRAQYCPIFLLLGLIYRA